MRPTPLLTIILLCLLSLSVLGQSRKDLDKLVKQTEVTELPYSVEEITVRGFDGANPPPRKEKPTGLILYGYGITSYIIGFDSITYFDVITLDAVHRNDKGKEIKRFEIKGDRYPQAFKDYFIEKCEESDRARIFFENIYLRDKSGNYLKIETEQRFCPHCVP